MSGGQLAKQTMTLRSALTDEKVIAQIQRALPSHMSADRMARVALTASTRIPKLNQCSVESVMQCLMTLSSMGLEPDGRMAHLIPYGNVCQLIVDYKGLVDIAYRSGMVRSIHADVVHEGDIFDYNLGEVLAHRPWAFRNDTAKPAKQGDVLAVYCVVNLVGGAHKHEVMTKDDVEGIRRRSQAGKSGPWVTDWNEMAKKTVFRRASKWIPMSAELRNHIDADFDSLPHTNGGVGGGGRVRESELNTLITHDPDARAIADLPIAHQDEDPETPPEEPKAPRPKAKPRPKAQPKQAELIPPEEPTEEPVASVVDWSECRPMVAQIAQFLSDCPDGDAIQDVINAAEKRRADGDITDVEFAQLRDFALQLAG